MGKWQVRRGEDSSSNKLTKEDVRLIRKLIAEGQTGIALSQRFGVSRATISHIKKGKTWRWLT